MDYTRRELLDLVLDFVGENDDPNARNTAERLVNIAVQTIWSKMAWRQFMMPAPYTFATASGTASYPLPAYFGRVRGGRIRNLTTGARIEPTNLEDLQDRRPGLGTTLDTPGTPSLYAIGGTVGVEAQVVAAGEAVTAVSSSASDLTIRIGLAGLDAAGRYRRNQYTLTGTTPVAVGTWTKVMEVAKAYPSPDDAVTEGTSSVGSVTLTGATSGDLLVLAPYESAIERIELTLAPTPDGVYTVSVPILRRPAKLLYDSDMTPLGWGPALLEEMHMLWMLNTGDIKARPSAGPALLDLIAFENSNRFQV